MIISSGVSESNPLVWKNMRRLQLSHSISHHYTVCVESLTFWRHINHVIKYILHIYNLSSGVYYNIYLRVNPTTTLNLFFIKCNVLFHRLPAVLVMFIFVCMQWADVRAHWVYLLSVSNSQGRLGLTCSHFNSTRLKNLFPTQTNTNWVEHIRKTTGIKYVYFKNKILFKRVQGKADTRQMRCSHTMLMQRWALIQHNYFVWLVFKIY